MRARSPATYVSPTEANFSPYAATKKYGISVIALVIFSASVNAYSANQVTRRNAWMTTLVSQSAPTGTFCAFTLARKDGIARLTAAECGTSAASNDQDR